MPPRSYIIAAATLVALVAISFPLTLGFSIILWYGLFAAAGCILAIAGAFKAANGLGASPWVAIALASPGFIWAIGKLHLVLWTRFDGLTRLALMAAAAGALRLLATVSGPRAAFRLGSGLLAAVVLVVGVGLILNAMIFTQAAHYVARTVIVAPELVAYGAFIGAAIAITIRRDIEPWTGVTISLIGAFLIYQSLRSMFPVKPPSGDMMFRLQPILIFVGGAAIWRIGSLLRAQEPPQQPAQSRQAGLEPASSTSP